MTKITGLHNLAAYD